MSCSCRIGVGFSRFACRYSSTSISNELSSTPFLWISTIEGMLQKRLYETTPYSQAPYRHELFSRSLLVCIKSLFLQASFFLHKNYTLRDGYNYHHLYNTCNEQLYSKRAWISYQDARIGATELPTWTRPTFSIKKPLPDWRIAHLKHKIWLWNTVAMTKKTLFLYS